MKLVYEEHGTKGDVLEYDVPMISVKVYVPFDEGGGIMPSLVSLRHGHYNNTENYGTIQWYMVGSNGEVQTVAQVIRQAIDMYDNLKQEKFEPKGG